ncbi:hypothetical protein [Arthrobacter ruber]|uniref:hypothetical protein n=1 Tax=Arthrobacter ruber TaxID=1258893 RepID=UPI0013000E28|nr:hypothetical protein [Arthrobacter ruber]
MDLVSWLADSGSLSLEISDRGTRGLGGPPQADLASPEEVYDWVDFVLNVGKPNTQAGSGGTYGFGKTISYVVSRINSIVVHSKSLVDGCAVERLIFATIGDQFNDSRVNFTGRHWWGHSIVGNPLPIEGAEARDIAYQLGMMPFDGDEFGTNILILAPDLGTRSPGQAMNFIAESILWHLWPKFADGASSAMQFSLLLEGRRVSIPKIEDRPPLDRFRNAYAMIRDQSTSPGGEVVLGGTLDVVGRRQRPKLNIGDLAVVPYVRQYHDYKVDDGSNPSDPNAPLPARPLPLGAVNHVVLLRSPDLVVEYSAGPVAPDPDLQWAAVFKVRDEYDSVFAAAEPPTHDAWIPDYVTKTSDRGIVRKSLRDIHQSISSRWNPLVPEEASGGLSTAEVAISLSSLVLGLAASGPGMPERRGRNGKSRARRPSSPEIAYEKSEITVEGDVVMSTVIFRIVPLKDRAVTNIDIAVGVALDDSSIAHDLDPALSLVHVSAPDATAEIKSAAGTLTLTGDAERLAKISAKHSSWSSIVWSVEPSVGLDS